MDVSSQRPNRPTQAQAQAHAQAAAAAQQVRTTPQKKRGGNKKRPLFIIIAAVVLIALIVGGILAYKQFGPSLIKRDKYQAVFLTNGQVYFGKLQTAGGYYKLSDVYYLQTTQSTENTADSANPQQAADSNSGVQLIKLGKEVHGPEDEMVIERSQVLFFENLRGDGTVTESIKSYQTK